MSWRSTLILAALAAGLLGYILVVERHRPDAVTAAITAARLLPGFDPGRVTGIEIIRSNSVLRLERTNQTWSLVQPVAYPAQSSLVETWLQTLAALNRRASLTAAELLAQPGGPAAFGLEPPEYTVNLLSPAGAVRLRLGSRTPVGEKMYLQVVGADGAHVTESALLDRMPRSVADWRDPSFVRLEGLTFNRLTLRSGPREFELQRDRTSGLWRLTRPRPARADNALFLQLMQQLLHTRVEEFVTDLPGADLEPYGLQNPEVELTLGQDTNTVFTIGFGRSPTNQPDRVYARRSSHPNIVTVPRDLPDRLHLPYTDLLDRRLAEVPPAAVQRLDLRLTEPVTLLRATNGAWRVTQPADCPADPELVGKLLQDITGLMFSDVAKEVVTDLDLPTYGLAPAARQIVLRGGDTLGATNQVLAQLDFGSIQGSRIFVRRSDETPVYATRTNDVLGLPGSAFELRDRQLLSFATNQVLSLTIGLKDRTWKLLRSPSGQWSFAPGSQGIVNTFALDEAIYRLGQLKAKAWVEAGPAGRTRYRIPETAHQLTLEYQKAGTAQTVAFAFGSPSPSGGPYAVTALELGDTVFEFPSDVFLIYGEVVRSLAATP